MILPSNEYTFSFSDKGERTKKTYEGSFTVKCLLTMEEIRQVGIRLDNLNVGSKTLAPGVALLNRAFAELDVRILKAPSWWKDASDGRDLFDTNIILGVFENAIDAERVFDERITEKAESDEQAVTKGRSKNKSVEKESKNEA